MREEVNMGISSNCIRIRSSVLRKLPLCDSTNESVLLLSHVRHAALLLLFPSEAKMAGVRVGTRCG